MKIYTRDDAGNYQINNKPYVSVTTVQGKVCGIYESLVNNYHCKLCRDYNSNLFEIGNGSVQAFEDLNLGIVHAQNDRKGKAEYGKMAHKTLEDIYFNKLAISTDFIKRCADITKIFDELGLELIHPESTVYSNILESAGTADIIAISRKFADTRLYIVDYKSGSAQKRKEIVQLGAYGKFVTEMIKTGELFIEGLGDRFTLHGLVLHIGRDDEFKVKPTYITPQQMTLGGKAYKDLLGYYRYTKTKL